MSQRRQQAHQEFESWSKSYDKSILQFLLFDPAHKLVVKELGDAGEAHILDIGCGTAKLAERLIACHRQAQVYGIDLSESMIRAGQRRITTEPRIHLSVADCQHLPFDTAAFDYITCSNSFHHYPDQLGAVREMHRVLKPGGKLFITDGYRDGWFGHIIYDVLVTRLEGGSVYHLSAEEFRKMFATVGFSDVRQFKVHFPAPFVMTSGVAGQSGAAHA